jgi:hypothetical protein
MSFGDWATQARTGEVHMLIGGIETDAQGRSIGRTLCGCLSGSFGWEDRDAWNWRCVECSRISS